MDHNHLEWERLSISRNLFVNLRKVIKVWILGSSQHFPVSIYFNRRHLSKREPIRRGRYRSVEQ